MKSKNKKTTKQRPFFTVIIPCYNSNPDYMNALLNSLTHQGIGLKEIEIIISDDCSTNLSYEKIVDGYKDLFNIIKTKTDKDAIHCPGNNRENAVQYATGEWIVFADHDDLFTDNALLKIKEAIIDRDEKYFIAANFAEVDPVDVLKVRRKMIHTQNWMHVKFYNLDNFWKAKNFHFVKDLKSHEDIAVSSKTHCELFRLGRKEAYFVDIIAYLWRAHPDSESRKPLGPNGFIEVYFEDYLESTGGVYLRDYFEYLDNPVISPEDHKYYHLRLCIDVILYMYFYIQGFKFTTPGSHKLENELIAKEYIRTVLNTFDVTRDTIYKMVAEKEAYWYNKVRESAAVGTGQMIETDSFKEFLYR